METKTTDYTYDKFMEEADASASRKYLANVFLWMFVALGLSAFTAYFFATNLELLRYIIDTERGGFTALGYVAVFSPIAFSMVINFGYRRIPYLGMVLIFIAYAVIIGISLSIICLAYTSSSLFSVFLTAALVFGVMAVGGYITNQDLTKFGTILYMIFIGAFLAGLVNFFIGSEKVSYILSFFFAATMIGLTAYYVQMLKRIGAGIEHGSDSYKKLVIVGAFTLFTTFINLFLSLLRIFGNRR